MTMITVESIQLPDERREGLYCTLEDKYVLASTRRGTKADRELLVDIIDGGTLFDVGTMDAERFLGERCYDVRHHLRRLRRI